MSKSTYDIKKNQSAEFRRFLSLKGRGDNLRNLICLNAIELRAWVQTRWQEGMSWENYGTVWVVDHIVPFRFFDLTNQEDLEICWNYKNLMPMYLKDNEKKNGNVYMSYILLFSIKQFDPFYQKLFDLVSKEVEEMDKYINIYYKNYRKCQ